ncbi:unnamed protein product [Malus baccata var. baccata]
MGSSRPCKLDGCVLYTQCSLLSFNSRSNVSDSQCCMEACEDILKSAADQMYSCFEHTIQTKVGYLLGLECEGLIEIVFVSAISVWFEMRRTNEIALVGSVSP